MKYLICFLFILFSSNLYSQQYEYKEGDNIIILFSAEWCDPCSRIKNVFKDSEIVEYLKSSNKKLFNIDIDSEKEVNKAWIKIGKPTKVPTLIIYELKDSIWEERKRNIGYMNKQEILKFIK